MLLFPKDVAFFFDVHPAFSFLNLFFFSFANPVAVASLKLVPTIAKMICQHFT